MATLEPEQRDLAAESPLPDTSPEDNVELTDEQVRGC